MINKEKSFFQFENGDLVYIISPLTSQLHMASRKVTVKYGGLVVIYKIIDPHNYILMTLDGKSLKGLFEHGRLKHTNIRTIKEIRNLAQLKQIINVGLKI